MLTQKFLLDMEKKQEEGMIEDLVVEFKTMFPKRCRILGDTHLVTVIKHCQKRASLYGYTHRDELSKYITLAFYLGTYFDEDPLYPWVQEILREDSSLGVRLDSLNEKFLTLIDTTMGEDFSLMIEAFNKFLHIKKEYLTNLKDHTEIVKILTAIYPQRMQILGEENFRRIIESQYDKLKTYNMYTPLGVYTHASVVFLLGSKVDQDPLYAWVGKYLNAPYVSQEQKLDVLYEKTLHRVRKELKDLIKIKEKEMA